MSVTPKMLWEPSVSRIKASHISNFIQFINKNNNKHIFKVNSSSQLYDWSIEEPAEFWSNLWDYCDVLSSRKGKTILTNPSQMPGATWFTESRMNYAEH